MKLYPFPVSDNRGCCVFQSKFGFYCFRGCGYGRQLSEAKLAEEKRSRGWNDPPPNFFPQLAAVVVREWWAVRTSDVIDLANAVIGLI